MFKGSFAPGTCVLFRGLHVSIDKPLHSLQGDFQSNMGSFVLKKSIQHFKKKASNPLWSGG